MWKETIRLVIDTECTSTYIHVCVYTKGRSTACLFVSSETSFFEQVGKTLQHFGTHILANDYATSFAPNKPSRTFFCNSLPVLCRQVLKKERIPKVTPHKAIIILCMPATRQWRLSQAGRGSATRGLLFLFFLVSQTKMLYAWDIYPNRSR